jgi:RNA polymerase sigma factor (sigma-70 family)
MIVRTVPSGAEVELVRRARGGDAGAFTALVHSHYSLALGYACALLRDVHDAEDATQEAFAEAYLSLPGLDDPQAFAPWLKGIVRHRCLRRLRQRDLVLVPEPSTLEALHAARAPADAGEPRERSDLFPRALRTLPRAERDVVALFYLKDCSQREIAAFLRLPITTVNNRLHEARKRLEQWGTNMIDTTIPRDRQDRDPALSVGTILRALGPVVEVRFDPAAKLDLFDALAVMGTDDRPVERFKIAHRAGDGRALCLVTRRGADHLAPGTAVLNTGAGFDLDPRFATPAVEADDLTRAVEVLAPRAAPPAAIFETGIKAVDLLCPLATGGNVAQVGVAGVGRIVLLEELRHLFRKADAALHLFGLVSPMDVGQYREWPPEGALQDRVHELRTYWVVAHRGTDPDFAGQRAFDAVHYCTPLLAVQGLFPAIDPEYSSSRLLTEAIAGPAHVALAARARALLVEAKRRFCPPAALELLASSAHRSARRAAAEFRPDIAAGEEAVRLGRARRLQFFLTQPFFVAAADNGWPGVSVPLRDTLEGCRQIVDGEADDLPVEAFRYAGTLDEVRARARTGDFRRFG